MVSMTRSPAGWLMLAAALPALAWVVCGVVWLAAAAVGFPRAVDGRTMTLTEATAIASYADADRLLRGGADPNAPSHLRAGLIRNRESTMTPLEAATGAIRTGPLQMLVDRGATIDDRNYPVLWCGAVARRNQDMARFLEPRRPAGMSSIDCEKVRPLW
jgi:hypothetical protein